MVTGLDVFRDHFHGHEDHFVLIGGAACDQVMGEAGLKFRNTRDLDIVLVVEALDAAFANHLMAFIKAGGYEIRQKAQGGSVLYRFSKPTDKAYPAMLELFSRAPEGLDIAEGWLTPLPVGEGGYSLSAILLDDAYYQVLLDHSREIDGLPVLSESGLIPFKASAWINLSRTKAEGGAVDEDDVRKHRRDVVRLSQLLAADTVYALPDSVQADMKAFVDAMEADTAFEPTAFDVKMTRQQAVDRLRAAYGLRV